MSKFIERRNGQRKITKKISVLYHANCADGFGAAYAAWKKFGSRAEYVPVQHQTPPPLGLKNKEIYTVDFTYLPHIMKKLIKDNKRVTSIDHHISAKETTLATHKPLYAGDHSGSVLAWKYFHPNKKIPVMLRHIEDSDLWKFKIAGTEAIIVYLDLFHFDFKVWDELAKKIEKLKEKRKIIEKGKLLLRYEGKLIERLVANNAERVQFAGYKTLAVNAPIWQSQIAHELYKKYPPIAIVWNRKRGEIVVSLRSDGTVDVSKLARRFGGGGHKAASGFSIPANKKFPWKKYD